MTRLGAVAVMATSLSIAHADPPKLAAHIAPMFERGKTWVYDISLQRWGDIDPRTDKPTRHTDHDKVTCKVSEVVQRAGVPVSRVTCDKDLGWKFPVAGCYAGTAGGLWRIICETGLPDADEVRTVLHDPPLIATAPTVFEKVSRMGGPDPKHDLAITGLRESPKIGGWCTYGDTSKGDPDGGRIVECYAPGIGIESGYNDVGGELNKLEYTVRR
jgi:hypothetical protein